MKHPYLIFEHRKTKLIGFIEANDCNKETSVAKACQCYLLQCRKHRTYYRDVSQSKRVFHSEENARGELVEGYDDIVIDFGRTSATRVQQFMNCDVIFAVVNCRKNDEGEFLEWLLQFKNFHRKPVCLLLNASRRQKRKFHIMYGLSCREVPFLENPYHLTPSTIQMFRELL